MKHTTRSISAMFLLICTTVSCSEETEWLGDPGDPCRSLSTSCVGSESVLRCTNEIWVEIGCAEFCSEQSVGLDSQGCVIDDCECTPPVDGCTPGEYSCEDPGALRICLEDWTWELRECESICGDFVPQSLSLGCRTDDDGAGFCLCTSEGAECTEEQVSFCAGHTTLAECVDAVWLYTECMTASGTPTICDPGALPYAACGSS